MHASEKISFVIIIDWPSRGAAWRAEYPADITALAMVSLLHSLGSFPIALARQRQLRLKYVDVPI